jgi:hypothetical protein
MKSEMYPQLAEWISAGSALVSNGAFQTTGETQSTFSVDDQQDLTKTLLQWGRAALSTEKRRKARGIGARFARHRKWTASESKLALSWPTGTPWASRLSEPKRRN